MKLPIMKVSNRNSWGMKKKLVILYRIPPGPESMGQLHQNPWGDDYLRKKPGNDWTNWLSNMESGQIIATSNDLTPNGPFAIDHHGCTSLCMFNNLSSSGHIVAWESQRLADASLRRLVNYQNLARWNVYNW